MAFDLSDKVAAVTGGGRGIGRGISRCLAAAGARVLVCGRDPEPLKETVEEIAGQGGQARAIPADITNPGDVDAVIRVATEELGSLDVWVNNAGSARSEDVGPLLETTESGWDAVVDLNLKWTFFACQAAARAMRAQGAGSIINISSRAGSFPNPLTGQYGAAKAAMESLTATMAVEWGYLGIRVNAVAPGVVLTERNTEPGGTMYKEERRERQIELVPLGRLGHVDDVGWMCVYLASEEAGWVSGEVITLNGGSRVTSGLLGYLRRTAASRRGD